MIASYSHTTSVCDQEMPQSHSTDQPSLAPKKEAQNTENHMAECSRLIYGCFLIPIYRS